MTDVPVFALRGRQCNHSVLPLLRQILGGDRRIDYERILISTGGYYFGDHGLCGNRHSGTWVRSI